TSKSSYFPLSGARACSTCMRPSATLSADTLYVPCSIDAEMAATLASSTAGISLTSCSSSTSWRAVPVMCTSSVGCSAVFGWPVTPRTRPTARPAPTAPVPRLSVPLILLDTSGLLDPVPVISTAMANTLGCDSNHVGALYDTFDDPTRGQILGLHAA